ncbi:MAG: hypothetical protein IJ867_04245 [Clostridia bacterium]|nr:hypothetical protein [Clostridia bacterium]
MKKTGKIFVSMTSLGVLLNNVAYATTEVVEESDGGLSTKYIFIGAAVVVIALLLFLGYKMDTKGNETATKVSHKAEKTKKKLSAKAEEMQQNAGKYEADEESYEEDGEVFDNEDLNDTTEYSGDDEDSLFSAVEDDDDEIEEVEDDDDEEEDYSNGFDTGAIKTVGKSEPEPEEEPEEEVGEEFDTSIIDKLDDEDEPKNSFDETMLFNNSDFSATGSSLSDEIDNLENISGTEEEEEPDSIDLGGDDDSFINELKSFEEPESSFAGFSVSSNDEAEKEDKFKEFKEEEKPKKVVEPEGEDITETVAMDDDFLSQMEANLQKNQADRKSKKSTTSTKSTTKKK